MIIVVRYIESSIYQTELILINKCFLLKFSLFNLDLNRDSNFQ